jgi:EAL domain-containing protein (putative c-di-GMP-specific phosphodiesterase class I)
VSASGIWEGRDGSFVSRAGTIAGRAIDRRQVVHCDDLPRNPGDSVQLTAAVDVLCEVAQFVAAALRSVLDMTVAMGEIVDAEFMAGILASGTPAEPTGRERLERVIAGRRVQIVAQPIVDLDCGRLYGVEALTRFPDATGRSPEAWFGEAHELGLGVELQLLAIARALELLDVLPSQTSLSLNAGPDALTSPALLDLLGDVPPERIVLELTEHLPLGDYADVGDALEDLRRRGFRLAIDDVGAGFSSFRDVVSLKPDMIKLDRCFTTEIDRDPTRRAMAASLVRFARTTGTDVCAEGIETERELEAIRALGIRYGQGYLLARPAPTAALPDCYEEILGGLTPQAA